MGRPGKYFRHFFSDPAIRLRLWKAYIHHKSIYAKGESEIGFLKNAFFGFQSFMVLWLFVKSFVPVIPTWVLAVAIPAIVVARIGIYYTVGRMWDRESIFRIERTWSNERDPMASEISRKLLDGSGLEVR